MPKNLSLFIGTYGFEASNCRNSHKAQQKLEKTKEGEVHDREILLSKIITINLNPSGPTDYFYSYVEPYRNPQLQQVEIKKHVEST
jgi:hypothetical protein